VGAIAFRLCYAAFLSSAGQSGALYVVLDALSSYVYLNLMLMFFNLIPLPPLDGSAIISPLLKGEARRKYYVVQRYSMPILLAVLYLVPMVLPVDPVGLYLRATVGNLAQAFLGI
jgi:Zn-dependent protease